MQAITFIGFRSVWVRRLAALLLVPGLGVDPSWALAVRRPVLVDHAAGVGAQADLLMAEQAISAFSDWSNRPPLFRNRQAKALEMVSESSALMEAGLPHGPSLITQSIAEAPSLVSRLPGFGSEKPLTAIVDLAPVGLSVRVWDERKSDPFTAEEERIFAEGSRVVDLGTLGLRREDVVSVRHTVYDRSSGDIRIRAIIEDRQGRKHFVLIHGAAGATSGSGVEQLKALMPPFEELGEPGAALQVSMGNQGDLDGNFLLLPQADGSWRLYGATDQDWQGRPFRALIQWADGRRWLGFIRLRGEAGTIPQVFFSVEGGAEQPLSPHDASFVLVANPLAWGSESGPKLLAESYTRRSDLRHIFNLPMTNGKLAFYSALAGSPNLLADAFRSFPVTLPLDPEMEPEAVQSALEAIGYHSVSRDIGLRYPGAFWLEGRLLHIVLLPAAYPLNALAVSADGAHLALVSVQGKSGRVGANYWTAGEDIRYEIDRRAGWKPYAVFALDNGMDPAWRVLDGPQPPQFPQGFGRPVNAALFLTPTGSHPVSSASAAIGLGINPTEEHHALVNAALEAGFSDRRMIEVDFADAETEPEGLVARLSDLPRLDIHAGRDILPGQVDNSLICEALRLARQPVADGYRSLEDVQRLSAKGRLLLMMPPARKPSSTPDDLNDPRHFLVYQDAHTFAISHGGHLGAYMMYPLLAGLVQLRYDIIDRKVTHLPLYKVERAVRLLIRHTLDHAEQKRRGNPSWENPSEDNEILALLSDLVLLRLPPGALGQDLPLPRRSSLDLWTLRQIVQSWRIMVGLHQITGGYGFTAIDEPTLAQFCRILIDLAMIPCLDNLAVLWNLRVDSRNDAAPIGFFFKTFEQAVRAALYGANLLIGPVLPAAQVRDLKDRFPNLIVSEVPESGPETVRTLLAGIASGADDVQLKPYAKAVAALTGSRPSLKQILRRHPKLLPMVAGGIFETNLEKVLRRPEGFIAAVGFNSFTPESFLAQAQAYAAVRRRALERISVPSVAPAAEPESARSAGFWHASLVQPRNLSTVILNEDLSMDLIFDLYFRPFSSQRPIQSQDLLQSALKSQFIHLSWKTVGQNETAPWSEPTRIPIELDTVQSLGNPDEYRVSGRVPIPPDAQELRFKLESGLPGDYSRWYLPREKDFIILDVEAQGRKEARAKPPATGKQARQLPPEEEKLLNLLSTVWTSREEVQKQADTHGSPQRICRTAWKDNWQSLRHRLALLGALRLVRERYGDAIDVLAYDANDDVKAFEERVPVRLEFKTAVPEAQRHEIRRLISEVVESSGYKWRVIFSEEDRSSIFSIHPVPIQKTVTSLQRWLEQDNDNRVLRRYLKAHWGADDAAGIPGASRGVGWLFGTNDPVKIGKIEGYWQSFAGVWALQVAHAQGLGNVSDLQQAALPAFIGFVIALLLAHYITGVVVSEHEQARRWDPWLSFKATGTALIGFVGWPLMALGVVVGGPVGLVMILAGFAAGPVLHGWANQANPFIAAKAFLASA